MKRAIFVSAMAAAVATAAASAGVIYSTGFEASEGFVAGDINGQNGWATYDPTATGGGGGFANVTTGAPAGFGGSQAVSFASGTSGTTSPRYAWGPAFGAAFAVLGTLIGMEESEAITPMLGVATFPIFMGIAYIGLWAFGRGKTEA